MPVKETPENPYAAAIDATPASIAVAWHHDFKLVGKRIHCRNGLWLPEICLLTGEHQNLVAMPVSVHALRKSRWWLRRIGIFVMILPVVASVLNSMIRSPAPFTPAAVAVSGGLPTAAIMMLLTFFIGLPFGLILFLAGGRRSELCSLQGYFQPQRLTVFRRFSNVFPVLMMLAVGLMLSMASLRSVFTVFAFLLMNAASILMLWLQKGLHLRAVVDENGVFVISGFSRVFLKRLGELQNSAKQK